MGINFPSSPTVGDLYPVPIVPGVPQYQWNGTAWLASSVGVSPPADDSVRYDTSQSLTAVQQTQARSNIYAAPFDAMAYSGMQINGGMEVSQEGVTASAHNGYFCDGWKLLKSGTMVVTAQQVVNPQFNVFTSFIQISVGTAQTSLGAGDFAGFTQCIEGYRIVRLGWGAASFAQPITISFWSRHARTGLYSGTIRNAANDRSYVFTYTQAATTPQYNTVTIPGCTDGTWLTTNGIGMYVSFSNGCGSTLTAPSANTWLTGNYLAAPGQVNGVAATSDVFRITGFVVLPGSQAPTAAQSPLIMRPYDQELLTCQRYYSQLWVAAYFAGAANSFFGGWLSFKAIMRAAPTVTPLAGYGATNLITAPYVDVGTVKNDGIRAMARSNLVGDAAFNAQYSCDARL